MRLGCRVLNIQADVKMGGGTRIDFSELERIDDNIGSGVEGKVHKVLHVPTGNLYALKENHDEDTVGVHISRELEVLIHVDHPNIIKCHDFTFKDAGGILLLLDYMDDGSLDGIRISHEPSLSAVTRHILSGLNYLHSRMIVHLDINPSNFLINFQRAVKISDFGISEFLLEDTCYPSPGTIGYMSPERIDDLGLRNAWAADIWSLGLSIWELYLGRYPLNGGGLPDDLATVKTAISTSLPPQLSPTASKELRDFIRRCVQIDPKKRWTAAQLLKHTFVLKHKSSGITNLGN